LFLTHVHIIAVAWLDFLVLGASNHSGHPSTEIIDLKITFNKLPFI